MLLPTDKDPAGIWGRVKFHSGEVHCLEAMQGWQSFQWLAENFMHCQMQEMCSVRGRACYGPINKISVRITFNPICHAPSKQITEESQTSTQRMTRTAFAIQHHKKQNMSE